MRSRDACMMKVMPMIDHGTPPVRLAPPNAIMGDTELSEIVKEKRQFLR